MDLSIIIVNWNSKEYLRNCIASILANTHDIEYEIIVIDNASFDGCSEMLRQEYPQVRFIQSEKNLGFAKANNRAFQASTGGCLLFLNPDTELAGPAINVMYERLRDLPDAGALGGKLLNPDRTVQTSCVQPLPTVLNQILDLEVFQRYFPNVGLWMTAAMFENRTRPVEVEALSGACLMIRREVFSQVEGFSTDYFMYAEDLDLCFKTRQAGLRNYYVPETLIIHHGGGSSRHTRSDFSNVMMRESVRRFLQKSRGDYYAACYRLGLAGASVARLLLLTALYPSWLIRGRSQEWTVVVWKWITILSWGIGLEKWAQKYDQLETTGAGSSGGKENACAGSAEN